MKIIHLLSILAAMILLNSCATVPVRTAPVKHFNLKFPENKTVREAETGGSIVRKKTGATIKGLKILESVHWANEFYPPQVVSQSYSSSEYDYFGSLLKGSYNDVHIGISKQGKKSVLLWKGRHWPIKKSPNHEVIFFIANDINYFEQELIYNGIEGNNLKITYMEHTNNKIRAPQNQDIFLDLNTTKEIAYKGARIQVIESSPNALKYNVINNFPNQNDGLPQNLEPARVVNRTYMVNPIFTPVGPSAEEYWGRQLGTALGNYLWGN